jgi:hypothetical protein
MEDFTGKTPVKNVIFDRCFRETINPDSGIKKSEFSLCESIF